MYRFLVIDDEPVVREGIRENIDWAAHGFELVGTCRDGREGLEAIERMRPDVVLTDICMPFVDGLELAGSISEQYPGTKTILLTGYDEFEYAQEAVRLKVSDFLLKPITASELRELLDSLKAELDTERSRERDLERLREQVRESLPVLRERFLNRLVRERVDRAEIDRKLALLELSLPGPSYIAMVCDADSHDPEDDFGAIAVQNIVAETAEGFEHAVTFSSPREETVVLLSAADAWEAHAQVLDCAEQVSSRVEAELARTVSIGTGDPVEDIARIIDSYRGARTAIEHRLVLGPNHIITVQQVRGVGAQPQPPVESESRFRFVRALKTGAREDARVALKEVFAGFRCSNGGSGVCYVIMHRLLAESLNALESLGIDYREVEGIGENPFEELSRLRTLEDMHEWFLQFAESAARVLSRRRKEHSEWKAVAAEEYIRSHYMDPDISLKAVCAALSISKSYLSTVFKAHTGMTFVEYLTDVRIEAAKDLLASDDLRSYEVAERVGFRDAHYFSLTFRKQTGVSPTEYRELARRSVR
jgi:two-component system response regulator YesN